ncbi:glycosyltransferase family 39 protein, partial [Candidatus Parcubacteria bacterium]|nr:glycosyltransferase family 39 protein [Candidatus Parcubacteria bacterium]
ALPLLGLNLKPASEFYDSTLAREPLLNLGGSFNQWNFAENFLFGQDESPEKILFLGRLMMVAITLLLGFLIFKWTSLKWGNKSGLLALALFCLSPLILAHGRIINMDVASALGIFASTYYFVRFLQKPSLKRTLIAFSVFGLTQLIKASALLLIPYFIILLFVWLIVSGENNKVLDDLPAGRQGKARRVLIISLPKTKTKIKFFVSQLKIYLPKLLLGLFLTLFIIIIVYQPSIWNYPQEQQAADIESVLKNQRPELYEKISWFPKLAFVPGLRNLAQYSFGALWQYTRSKNIAYFHGQGAFESFPFYFPIGYLIKEPLAFHILTLLGLWFVIKRMRVREKNYIKSNFFVIASLLWVGFYWFMIVTFSPINSGIRYLIPTLPFIYFLIAGGIGWWLNQKQKGFSFKHAFIGGLLVWQLVSVLTIYPSFLSYFNELIGGPENGYRYMVDTDVEWGQDVKRLSKWVESNGIEQIAVPSRFIVKWEETKKMVNYSVPSRRNYQYYLDSRYKYLPPDTRTKGWVAIPARLLQWGTAKPANRHGWFSDSYNWLKDYEPVTKIGYSIFVYYIN